MPKSFETGHAKNVANLLKVNEICKGYGPKYNPSKAKLKLANLIIQQTNCAQLQQDVKDALQKESTIRKNRAAAFKGYNKYATRLLAAVKSCGVSNEFVNQAISINKKIQGERITEAQKTKNTEGEEVDNSISTSQKSYDNLVDHFKKFKTFLTSLGATYAPNETDLQVTYLNNYINNLDTLNSDVSKAEVASANALINRNKIFYAESTGIPDTAKEVKQYVKSVFGASSPEYKQISKISFTSPKK